MKVDSMLLEIETHTNNANICKDEVIFRLLADEVITKEQAKVYTEKWNFIIIKPTWFERWMKAFPRVDPNHYQYKFVRFED